MLSRKAMITLLIVGQVKRHSINKRLFSRTKIFWRKVKAELYLSTYVTKADLKNATDADTSKFAEKVDLTNLKSNLDKSNIDKFKNVTVI